MVMWRSLGIGFVALFMACARNPNAVYEDGRLYFLVDMDSRFAAHRLLLVRVEAEGYEARLIKIFDYSKFTPEQLATLPVDVTGALDWVELQGRPYDIMGTTIRGGSEVTVTVQQGEFDVNSVTFKMDGDTQIRVFIKNPELPGAKHLQIERSILHVGF